MSAASAAAHGAGDAARDPISLHLGALLWVPTGSPGDNTGDGAARVEGPVVLAGRIARVARSAGVGVHLRGAVSALNLAVGDELRATAAVGVSLLGDRLGVGPEASAFTSIGELPRGRGNAAFVRGQWGAEVLLGARWRVADPVQVGLAGGLGLGDGYGVPEARAAHRRLRPGRANGGADPRRRGVRRAARGARCRVGTGAGAAARAGRAGAGSP
jgi:hypothetical protein